MDTSSIEKLYIGFGVRGGSSAGGDGTMYFDDIHLYSARCTPGKVKPEADLNNDCAVDFGDVEVMADAWLEADVNLGEVREPCDANLVGWWKLDDGDGKTAADSSGNDYNGVIETIDEDVWWVAGRADGNALEFGGGRVMVPDDGNTLKLRLEGNRVGVTAWINVTEHVDGFAELVVRGRDNYETFGIEINEEDRAPFPEDRDCNVKHSPPPTSAKLKFIYNENTRQVRIFYGLNGKDATTELPHSKAGIHFGRPLTESTAVYIMMSNGRIDLDYFGIKPINP